MIYGCVPTHLGLLATTIAFISIVKSVQKAIFFILCLSLVHGYAQFRISQIVRFCFQHRPIRHRRYGYDGIDTATAACSHGAVEAGSGHQAHSRVCGSGGHCKIYQRTRAGRLLTRWILQSES